MLVACFFIVIKSWQESRAWVKYLEPSNIIKAKNNPQHVSSIGNASDSAYVAEKTLGSINKNLSKMNEKERKSQIPIAINLVNHLEEELKIENNNFRAHWVTGQLINLLIYLNGEADSELIEKAKGHFNLALEINPNNSLVYFDMAQIYLFERNFNSVYAWIRAGIALAPQYPNGYKIAHRILSITPDKDFQKYIDDMEKKWAITP